MKGAFVGDIIGSAYEWSGMKSTVFPLHVPASHATDDSFMTAAVALAFGKARKAGMPETQEVLAPMLCREMRTIGRRHIHAGFGHIFKKWLLSDDAGPYGSFGNGAPMRVSPAAWYGRSMEETKKLALISASVSHNHPSSEKAAECVAGSVFLARQNATKAELEDYMKRFYKLPESLEAARNKEPKDATCDGTVPDALLCFLSAKDYEEAVRNAVSLGGDSDTLAAMAGSIAEPFFGIPERILAWAEPLFTSEMREALALYKENTAGGN
jgi:ADP-ribosyl-[dinitrogen reductase] hydrolase